MQNPARSNLVPSYTPGISAVSPPTSSQPASSHPNLIPASILLLFSKSSLPVA